MLRPIVEEDRARIVAIRQTDEIARRWHSQDVDAEFTQDLADDELHQFAIECHGELVGMIQYSEEQNPDYRHASIDLFVDPAFRRRGLATAAITTLVNYLFDERGHHRLIIDPAADNEAAIACYKKVGFTPVGVMRAYERQRDGSWSDGLLMEMLRATHATDSTR